MHFEDSTKGNRNAIYNLPYKMNGTVRIELDWKVGECTGGQSYGELRFADSSKNTFFALKTQKRCGIAIFGKWRNSKRTS